MKCEVLGKKKSAWVDESTGEAKQSAHVFVAHRHPADNQATTFEGQGCSDVTIPFEYYDEIPVGGKVLLDFDTNKKLLEIEILD